MGTQTRDTDLGISTLGTASDLAGLVDGTDSIHSGILNAINQQTAGSFVAHGLNVIQSGGNFSVSSGGWFDKGEYKTGTPTQVTDDLNSSGSKDHYAFLVIPKDTSTLDLRTANHATNSNTANSSGVVKIATLKAGDIPVCLIKVAAGASAGARPIQFYGIKKLDSEFTAVNNETKTLRITKAGKVLVGTDTGEISFPSVGSTNSTLYSTNDKGISNGNVLVANANVADNDFLKVDGTEIEGRTAAEVKSDLALVKGDVGLGNVDNTTDAAKQAATLSAATATDVGLGNVTNESKATMFTSPTFTGTIAIPNIANLETAVAANTAKTVRTDSEINALAQAKVDAVIDSAPGALNTLNELAAALGDDASYATTITNQMATKTKTFKQDDVPTSTAVGDLWIDTNDNNKLYHAHIVGADEITAGEWVEVTVGKAALGLVKGDVGLGSVLNQAQIKTFKQDAIPTSIAIGDQWYDTNDSNKLYVAESAGATSITSSGGGGWVLISLTKTTVGLSDLDSLEAGTGTKLAGIAAGATVGATTSQANEITANTAKVGITTSQANAITANTAKVSYEFDSASDLGTAGDIDNDVIPIYDDGASAYKKVKMKDFLTKITANQLVSGGSGTGTVFTTLPSSGATVGGTLGSGGNILLEDGSTKLTDNTALNANTNWSDVAGTTNAPANNATVGAVAGTNLKAADGSTTLGDADIKNASLASSHVVGSGKLWAATLPEDGATKGKTFRQDGIPTSTNAGDLWVDTNDSNKIYQAAAAGADEITSGEWELLGYAAAEANATASSGTVDTTGTVNANEYARFNDANTLEARTAAEVRSDLGIADNEIIDWTASSAGTIHSSNYTNTTYSEATGSAAGLMSIAHHDKLDAIEASADVTDSTNVTAAGALMDSEVTNLAFVKGLASGISNGNVLVANANVADNDFLKVDGTSIEGRTAAEVLSDLGITSNEIIDWTASSAGTIHSSNYTDTTYSSFSGSTSTAGLVPVRDSGATTTKYLREDGDWVVPPDTTTNTQNTYASSWVDSSDDVLLRLTAGGAGSGTQDIKLVAGSNVSLTPSGTDMTIASTDTTYSVMASGNSYAAGLVPTGASSHGGLYLRKDGTWADPDTDTNDYVNSLAFNTGDGVLTVGRTGSLADLTVDLDGRYVTTGSSGEANQTITTGSGIDGADSGSTGNITLALGIQELSDVQIASGDKLLVLDSDGSTHQLESIDDIATLFAGSNLTATSGVLAVDDAFLKNDANDTTTGTITAGGFTTTGSITLAGHAVDDIDIGGEFVDSDNHLMTSAAIQDKILGYSYITASSSDTLTNKTIAASQVTEISNLTAAEGEQLENIGTTTISATQWGYLGAATGAITNTDTVDMGDGFTVTATTSGTNSTITEGDTLTIAAGTGITTTATSDGTITIASTVSNTDSDVSVANLKTRLAGGFGSNAVTIGDSDDVVTIGNDLTVTGDLIVSGDTVTVNTATLSVEDPLVYLANGQTGTPSVDIGLIGERGSSTNVGIIWDESADTWAAINTSDTGTTAGNVTIASYANMKAATFTGALTGDVTGDVTGDLTGNADTVTNGVYTTGNQTIGGTKTFSSTITGSISGNAATVTTNANLTGDITSSGNATSIASGVIVNDDVNASAAIAYSKLNLTGAVLNADLAGSIANAKLANSAITIAGSSTSLGGSITADTIAGQISSGTITNAQLAGSIAGSKLATGAVDTTQLADDAVDSDKIGAGEVGNAALAASGLSASKMTTGTLPDARYDSGISEIDGKGAEQEFSVQINKAMSEADVWIALSGSTDEGKFTSKLGEILTIENEEVRIISLASTESSAPTNDAGDTINHGLKATRGARGTTAATHTVNTAIKPDKNRTIQITKTDASSSTEKGFIPEFSGADANVASVTGLVPQAAIGDQAKYLRGDGTWQTLSGAGSTGTVTQIVASTGLSGGTITTTGTIAINAAQTGITSLLATDIKIGEDDQTKIDFETADEIHFYAANAEQVYVADGIFGPQTDSDVDLGSTSVRWKDAFVDSITVTGEVDGASLDISGDADIDGTLEADAITIGGTAIGSIYSPVAGHSSIATVGTITTGTWQGTAIASSYIAADAITGAKIADDAIDSEHYTDGSIDTAHIADNQVTLAKMAGLTRGSIIIGNASGDPAALAIGSNDYVLTSDGTDIAWEAASGGIASLAADTTPQLGGDLDVNGNKITSASNADITIEPNGTGDILLYSDKMVVGDSSANWEIAHRTTTNSLLRFQSGGNVQLIADDAIYINSGEGGSNALIRLKADKTQVGNNNVDHVITTTGTGDLTLSTNDGTNAGTIVLADGANNDITLTPNGTGDIVLDGLKWPQADGTANYVLKTDGSAQLSWTEMSSGASAITGLSDALKEDNSIYLGSDPSGTTDSATHNTAVGDTALDSITTADYNVAIGSKALTAATTGAQNVAIGYSSMDSVTQSTGNVGVGYLTLQAMTDGTGRNNAIGYQAGWGITSGSYNQLMGYNAGVNLTTGSRNIGIGNGAIDGFDTESDNIGIGYDALGGAIDGGEKNIAIGNYSGDALTTADENVFLGYKAGTTTTTGYHNVAIGAYALENADTGNNNVAIGYEAMECAANTNADDNVAIGKSALKAAADGTSGNVAIGVNALTVGTGDDNTAVGYNAANSITTGQRNVMLGTEAGHALVDDNNNTIIGYQAGDNLTAGNGNVIIGCYTDAASTTASGQLAIGTAEGINNPFYWIKGTNDGTITMNHRADVVAVSSNTTLTNAQTGSYVYWTAGTLTLPANSEVGTQFTIFNNTGGSATVGFSSGEAIVSGWASNAAVADHDATAYVCVATDSWVQVGA